ncbi:MAG: PEP-CTERM sorting domain-containing protein [Pirellulales bacterium]|nr:PEP-CTERM sorting domain-containing protein [Pirellulales bacterium]
MKLLNLLAGSLALALATGVALNTSADTITAFTFEQLAVGINNTPAPAVGSGSATTLGMTNNLTTPPSVSMADVILQNGTSGPATGNKTWRIRSAGTGNGNGWSALAPQYSQGAEFLASTTGFQDIFLTFDWSATTQGVKHLQAQYTTDGSSWLNAGGIQTAGATEGWINGITVDLSSLTAADNNPLFGVRLVSAFAPSGPNAGQYVNLAGNPINSTSGNWRVDNIIISGSVIPEPSTWLLAGFAVVGLSWCAARRARTA